MDRVKKTRGTTRSAFTRVLTALTTELAKEVPERIELQSLFALLKDKASELEDFNAKMIDLMVDSDAAQSELETEVLAADEYRVKYHRAKVDVARIVETAQYHNASFAQQDLTAAPSHNNAPFDNRRGFKLPKIELKKFNGDVREWLQFWSQFKNIHEDESIKREDKFQYLIQAMVTGSRASELVNSYPPTAENYDKVIKSLKSRFGKNELLVEVYVRELLKLVLNNALAAKESVSLASVYDKLETHIRSLESLGVTTDTCAAMLYPLVESSLPEELLRTWQRQTSSAIQFAAREPGNNVPVVPNPKERLVNLMTFLQAEVENEERIAMAVSGFGLGKEQGKEKRKNKTKSESSNETATAAALLTTKEGKSPECIFCSEAHESSQCEKARKMSMDERQEVVKQKNACFNCLKTGHGRRFCRYKQKCAWCGKNHALLMCRGMTSEKTATTKKHGDGPPKSQTESSLANLSCNNEIFLQTVRVKVYNNGEERIVRAVLDTGSHRSYVLRQTVEELGYEEVGRQSIIHLLFGGAKTEAQEHKAYRIRLRSLDDSYACNFVALDQDTICHSISGITRGPWIQELAQDGIRLTDVGQKNEPIAILIGADIVGKLLTGRLQNLKCGTTAIETRLGWTMLGKTAQRDVPRVDAALLSVSMITQTASVSDLWSLDTLGITDPIETKTKEAHQEQVKNHFRQTVKVNEKGRYEVLLPWKENHPPLSDNKDVAFKRLEINTKRLKSENLFEDYGRIIRDWTAEGIIERVPPTEEDKRGYYLPHRHVIKQNSTTPLRPVFDASAKSKDSPSLNQCLEVGPNLIELIPSMLLRFREKRIGIISDVKRAFLQISVTPKDRDVLRFLWWNEDEPTKVDIYRHCRVVFGVTSSPFLLGATIEMHLEKELREIEDEQQRSMIEKLKRSFYVDNCVTSVDTEEEKDSFERVATKAMMSGGFLLRGWEYSDPLLSQCTASVLGLTWDKGKDTLVLTKAAVDGPLPEKVTKRNILSITQKIFDPIGLACPVLLRPKLLLQKLWSTDLDWDTEVDKETEDTFRDWHRELNLLLELRLPRWAFGEESNGDVTSFHVFVDASREAYAAVLYARTDTADGVKVQLIEAKSRVAPMGKTTTPRLELLAATIGARLMAFTLDVLGKSQAEKRFWSDSSTVLSWIKRENQWATFVWNRVQEIRRLTHHEQWYHVPGSVNPADLPSRGCSARQLLESRWWEGPEWLKKTRDQWPSAEYEVDENEVSHEIKKTSSRTKKNDVSMQSTIAMTNVSLTNTDQDIYWYMRGLSKYSRILRTLAWILRFVARCRKDHSRRRCGELTAKDIVEAELKLMRLVQKESFDGVADPRIKSLSAYEDKLGLIRLKTPISNRDDRLGFRCPIVLDPQHPLVTKFIQYRHEKLNHAGIQIMMSNLREQVWILTSRRAIRSVLARCITCRRYKATRIETSPASLPEERVRDAAVFEVSGVDFAGPVYLKGGEKAWICLFTCAVYRAVHLELVTSLSTELFIGAFRRFIARRGRPAVVYSDNGTNFTGASNLLRGVNWNKIAEYSTVEKIDWRFNPPAAAWWGGWWERLVRSVKELLRKVLGRACLTFEDLTTTLCDCEAIINSRPITYVSENPEELVPLTPAMFLQDIREVGVPDLDNIEENHLSRRRRYRQRLQEDLRRRFRSEYLGQLSRAKSTKAKIISLQVGDVVFVGHDNQKRLDWPLARVIEVIPGRDGIVRVARLKTASGELVRPVQRLYPLEMTSPIEIETIKRSVVDKGSPPNTTRTPEIEEKEETPSNENSELPIEEEGETPSNENFELPIENTTAPEKNSNSATRKRSGRQVNAPKRLDL